MQDLIDFVLSRWQFNLNHFVDLTLLLLWSFSKLIEIFENSVMKQHQFSIFISSKYDLKLDPAALQLIFEL